MPQTPLRRLMPAVPVGCVTSARPERSRALTTIALDSNADHATALVAPALCAGHWSICLPALVRLAPEVVTAIGAESLRVHDQEERPLRPTV
ncbi:hypothetical protein ACIBG6_38935 [Streptomyces sp. NPDC050842]|uniref:hypothetical protein n=1 Tax=Streptomyces sp. NPDC050842 TaxID=3365636 RepID=UPI003797C1BE